MRWLPNSFLEGQRDPGNFLFDAQMFQGASFWNKLGDLPHSHSQFVLLLSLTFFVR